MDFEQMKEEHIKKYGKYTPLMNALIATQAELLKLWVKWLSITYEKGVGSEYMLDRLIWFDLIDNKE